MQNSNPNLNTAMVSDDSDEEMTREGSSDNSSEGSDHLGALDDSVNQSA